MTFRVLETSSVECARSVQKLLDDAAAEGFEEIVLVGIRRNGNFMVMGSRSESMLRRIGCLQVAVHDTIEAADEAG